LNLREKQKQDTMQKILRAAQALFMTQGYTSVTTRAIAEAADVRQPLIYHYFGTKEKLYLTVVMHVSDAMAVLITKATAGSASFAVKLQRLGHQLTNQDPMDLQLVLHDVFQMGPAVRQTVVAAWEKGFLLPLDAFFAAYRAQLQPAYAIRDITLYFLTILSAFLPMPAMRQRSGRLTLDTALVMFRTGVETV
jgi:AcrR family transcriptional regulator